MHDVGKRVAKGAAWMVLSKLCDRGLGLLSTVVLARLLVPADFGLVAMATAVIGILDVLTAFSFDIALIQNRNADREHYDTAWTLNLLFATCMSLTLIALAIPSSHYYAEPRIETVMYALSAGVFVLGWENIGVVAFRKELALDKEFRFLLAKRVISVSVTVTCAVIWRNYWALVAGMLVSRVAGVGISYLVHPFRPRFSLAARRSLFSFSKWVLLNNLFVFINTRLGDLVIGRVAGAGSLGLYSVSYEISNLPTTELVAPINRAVYPGYAQLAGDRPMLRDGFLVVMSVLIMFVVPASAGIAALADLIVSVALGERWMGAVQLIQVLAFHGAFMAVYSNSGYTYLVLGKPHFNVFATALLSVVLVPLLLVLANRMGALGAAWALLIAVAIVTPVALFAALRHLEIEVAAFVRHLWRPVVAATVMFLLLGWLKSVLVAAVVPKLFALIALGALSYFLVLFLLWRMQGRPHGGESLLLSRLHLARIGSAS